jgi:catechol 2,3-dioxygenase-like lactoylglutathione lyase family enzyme
MADTPPAAEWGQLPTPVSIYETVLYYRTGEDEAMKRFYNVTLGLPRVPDSDVAFRLGTQMLLLFNAEKSEVQDSPPAHGSTGRTHVCFRIPDGSLDSWKQYLQDAGVKVLEEITWQTPSVHPAASFYFEDPAGNLLELMDGDVWTA